MGAVRSGHRRGGAATRASAHRAGRRRDARRYAQTTRIAFTVPPVFEAWLERFVALPAVHAFLGRQDGEPAAAGLYYRHGDFAWIGLGATLPAYRGRGWQPALLQQRLRDAASCGCKLATSETARLPGVVNPSYDNLAATLELQYLRRNFLFTNP